MKASQKGTSDEFELRLLKQFDRHQETNQSDDN